MTIPGEWRASAACRGMNGDLFFLPELRDKGLRVCGRCDVAKECLEYSLASRERYGIWGGKDEKERWEMMRVRRASSA